MSTTDTVCYETTDIGLVAFLQATGSLLVNAKKESGSYKIRFYFSDYETARSKAFDYYGNQQACNVNARAYAHALDDVKNIMYSSL